MPTIVFAYLDHLRQKEKVANITEDRAFFALTHFPVLFVSWPCVLLISTTPKTHQNKENLLAL